MNSAIDRAVNCIWERYGERLSPAELARSAMLSRFQFPRAFKEHTGVPPARFLAAVRIYRAKRMLLVSPMSVAGVSRAVGYSSPSSFTSDFTDSVGVSPNRFRYTGQHDAGGAVTGTPVPEGAMMGTVRLPEGYAMARVYVGIFDTPIVQRRPQSATLLDVISPRTHTYWLPAVPDGRWFLHAVAVADTDEPEPWTRRHLLVGGGAQVKATLGAITLRPRSLTDLPPLLALPDLEAELEGLTRSAAPATDR